MSGISSIYFLDLKGRIIIFRNYRGEVTQNISESFQDKVIEFEESNLKPVFTVENTHYCWIRHQNIYIVSVSKRNINLALIFSFLHKLVEVLISYFDRLEEESLVDNFVIIFELLDELVDNGLPQITETKMLKEYIKTGSHKLKSKDDHSNDSVLSRTITSAISWRKGSIFYKKNEIFLDVIEKVNTLIGANGSVIRSEIIGTINGRCFLSGTPNLKLGLNEKALFEYKSGKTKTNEFYIDDVQFHQCVDIHKFSHQRTIEFVPPDGNFVLANYRMNKQLQPIIMVQVKIEHVGLTKKNFTIIARTNFKNKTSAINVEISIPAPRDAFDPSFNTTVGNFNFLSEKESFVWKLKNFPSLTEYSANVFFFVPSVRIDNPDSYLGRPINVVYEIPYFTISGIHVKYLKVTEQSGYEAMPWVRYVTESGEYHIRMI